MMSTNQSEPTWGSQYRLVASEKWKAKSAAMGHHMTEALVAYAQPAAGMRVLDLASGTGEPAITLAMRVGGHGHVTALDLSEDLLKIAQERATARGLQNFSTRIADAHQLPFPDESFDLATSRCGVMFFRDVASALRGLLRVLRPQARACFLVWGPFDQPYWRSTMGTVHRRIGGPLLQSGGADPFRFAESGSLSKILQDAGFRDVHEETRTVDWIWMGTAEEVWEYAKSVTVPFRPMLDRVPAEMWPQIDQEVHAAVDKFKVGDSLSFGATVVLASGRK